ncbi:hypothetical protein B0H14DRAFT_3484355 [Mycena olivaceomarginata]|nr:hypothetical protein B0H14DRAFT_3484355 [Mycena olivaceomarginata]
MEGISSILITPVVPLPNPSPHAAAGPPPVASAWRPSSRLAQRTNTRLDLTRVANGRMPPVLSPERSCVPAPVSSTATSSTRIADDELPQRSAPAYVPRRVREQLPSSQDSGDACEREGLCLSRSLQLRARVGLAPLEHHLRILLLRAITRSRRPFPEFRRTRNYPWPSASSASSHPALSSLGVTYLAPTLAQLVHSGYGDVSSSRSTAYGGHAYLQYPASAPLGVRVRVFPPQQLAPMLVPKLHAHHADSAHVQPPVIILSIA